MPSFAKFTPSLALSALTIALLAACGDGEGGSSPQTTLSGVVIDGYIQGAKVCLDVNANGVCNATEPSTTTDSGGKYKLETGNIETIGLNVIAEIPDTAKDSDDGGLTLQEAGKSAYTMATAAAEPSVVTPLTTLIAGKVKSENLTPLIARIRVLEELGLPSDVNIHDDHIASGNSIVHGTARQVAAQLQQAQKNVPPGLKPEERIAKIHDALKSLLDSSGSIAMESHDTNPLNMPDTLSNVATGRLFAYKMPSAMGKQINATAMLFTPKTPMPEGGWPLVVFGHGTVGVAQNCAPSVTMRADGNWGYAGLVALIVSQGAVVVAPDYEGLGSSDMGVTPGHPYLNLGSAGRSMALAAVGAKKLMTTQLSGAWATMGHSQGGHAALAGAQFAGLATKQEPSLYFRGAVAIAPASNLLTSLNTMWSSIQGSSNNPANFQAGYEAVGIMNGIAAYVVKGTQSTPTPAPAEKVLGARIKSLYDAKAGTECLGAMTASITNDITQYAVTNGAIPSGYTGVINAVINSPSIIRVLASNEPGQVKLPGNNLIVQGSADTTVLPSSSQTLLNTMKAKGSQVTLKLYESSLATHSGVLDGQKVPEALAAIEDHLGTIFATK